MCKVVWVTQSTESSSIYMSFGLRLQQQRVVSGARRQCPKVLYSYRPADQCWVVHLNRYFEKEEEVQRRMTRMAKSLNTKPYIE